MLNLINWLIDVCNEAQKPLITHSFLLKQCILVRTIKIYDTHIHNTHVISFWRPYWTPFWPKYWLKCFNLIIICIFKHKNTFYSHFVLNNQITVSPHNITCVWKPYWSPSWILAAMMNLKLGSRRKMNTLVLY